MIRYSLVCSGGHEFESWFSGSAAYDEQVRRGFVECPICRTTTVSKAIMSPRVARSDVEHSRKLDDGAPEAIPGEAPTPSSMPVVMDERLVALRGMFREMRATIMKNTADVGASFPDQARKMHTGEIEHRAIRGEATPDEVRDLLDEGVSVLPVPPSPDDRN